MQIINRKNFEEETDRIARLERDAALWNRHKHVFYQMERMLNEARPLVHTLLNIQDAVKDAK